MKSLGQIAYESHCAGSKLAPDWHLLTPMAKDHWEKVAAAVEKEAVRRHTDKYIEDEIEIAALRERIKQLEDGELQRRRIVEGWKP